MTAAQTRCDVLVVGAGLAGASVAAHLAGAGVNVVLAAQDVLRRRDQGTDLGHEVFSTAALAELARLGWLDRFRSAGDEIRTLAAAWGGVCSEVPSITDPRGPSLDFERERLAAVLADLDLGGVRRIRAGRELALNGGPGDWRLDLAAGTVTARFLVDATGRGARLARRLGARWIAFDRMIARVARFVTDRTAEPTLLVEAVPEGWLYSTASAGAVTITCLGDADLTPRGRAVEGTLAAVLCKAPLTRARLAGAALHSAGLRVAACGRLDRAEGEGLRAVGDAAEAWDPLSGSGAQRAICSARLAAGSIAARLSGRTPESDVHQKREFQSFEIHNAERRRYYSAEPRWPQRLFWRRRRAWRHEAAALFSPEAVLVPHAMTNESLAPAEAWLPPRLARQMVALFGAGRPAHEVLRSLRLHPVYPGDGAAVFVLQTLLASGALRFAGPLQAQTTAGR
jgi:flavin-dependent dehydrogenase